MLTHGQTGRRDTTRRLSRGFEWGGMVGGGMGGVEGEAEALFPLFSPPSPPSALPARPLSHCHSQHSSAAPPVSSHPSPAVASPCGSNRDPAPQHPLLT